MDDAAIRPPRDAVIEAVALFNAEDYRGALLLLEARWHGERDETLRALILLCNALNQLRLGLADGPRRNLATAARLLDAAPAQFAGLDIAALRAYTATLRALLGDAGALAWAQVPRVRLTSFAIAQTAHLERK